MKKTLLSTAMLALAASSALAADLPYRKAPPPPAYIPPPPVYTWNGFYVGLNAGGTWLTDGNVLVQGAGGNVPAFAALQTAGAVPTQLLGNGGGFLGGGQIGYNWQFSPSFLVGIEADIQGLAGNSNSASAFGTFAGFPFATSASRSLDYIGTVRGRIGWLFTPTLLIYGTGGFAYGQANLGLSLVGPAPFGLATSFSNTQTGYAVGGGVEWMFLPNWSAKIEYLYYELGSPHTPPGIVTGGGNFDSLRAAWDIDGHIVRAGVNYHFNWGAPAPVYAKY